MTIMIDIQIYSGKRRILNNYALQYLLLLLKIVFVNLITIKNIRNLNNYDSIIHLVTKGNGNQKLLYKNFYTEPSEVLVNGIKDNSCKKTCNIQGDMNNVTLIFKNKLTSCYEMFRELSNIIEIDLSNFDTSQVITMYGMFLGCSNLKYLDLSNFDTSKLSESISYMFKGCSSLIYLNLISFKINSIKYKTDVFDGNSPNTKYCTNDGIIKNLLQKYNKFSNCSDICFQKNIKIDLINNKCIFSCEDNNYKYIYNDICYDKCPKDTYALFCNENECNNNRSECYDKDNIPQGYYLDLNNKAYKKCYKNCKSCAGLGNETFNNCIECNINFTFLNDSTHKTNCYEKCNYYHYFDKSYKYHCNKTCPENYNKIIKDKNKCIDECKNDDIYNYKYEYNNNCYKKCPNETYLIENNENNICFSKAPDGYYLDKSNKIFKICYKTCNKCELKGNKINNYCIECKPNYEFYTNLNNISNCYKKCDYYYYFNESNEFYCTEKYECPLEYNKLIKDKNKCIDNCTNDDIYKYEYNNNCLRECPEGTSSLNDNYICIINEIISSYTNIIKDARDEDINEYRNEFVSSFNISENKEDIITSKDNVSYQMTTSDSQKNNSNKNISSINLGVCEDKLKSIYGIDPSLPLIIFKIDYFSPDTLIPIIGYEIYHPINKSKLDLKYCEEILIKLNIPVNIDESKLFRYDPNSEYYTDNCFSYTTEDGTDITLNDRKKEYSNNNLALCENNCNYTGYDKENKQSSCDCNVKNKMETITEIIGNQNKLSNSFDSGKEGSSSGASNIITIKCTKVLFSKEGLKNNISSYILLIFIGYFLVAILLFLKCGNTLLNNEIQKIMREKDKIEKLIKKENNFILPTRVNNAIIAKKTSRKKINNFPPKKYKFNFIKNANSLKYNKKIFLIPRIN